MAKLLIAADDFTGALDTAVQFAACGAEIRVITDPDVDFRTVVDCEVLVVDTETRHIAPEAAARIIEKITRAAVENGVTHLMKKTDSALRGNVGAELSAMLRASGCKQLPFLPAFPQIGRCTREGIHYIQDVPVSESVFGTDPFEPVRHSRVTQLLAEQTDMAAYSCPAITEGGSLPEEDGILVFDASTLEQVELAGRRLLEAGKLTVMAGCAGLASVLGRLLNIGSGTPVPMPKLDSRMLVVCGSVNPITVAQLAEAEKAGFAHLRLSPEQKLKNGYWQTQAGQKDLASIRDYVTSHDKRMIDTNDLGGNQPTSDYAEQNGMTIEDIRQGVSRTVGIVVNAIIDCDNLGTLLVTGGDTLLQCMDVMGVHRLSPIGEFAPGVVLSRFEHHGRTHYAITKSGGFGTPDLIVQIASHIQNAESYQ